MDDERIHERIDELVAEEHALRSHGALSDAGRARLDALEAQLDQAWDLLRQRAALRDAGADPEAASARPLDQVEGYLQ
jgi:hypothetical protein